MAAAAALLCGSSPGEAIAYTVTHHRWVLACFLMPVSFVFDGFWMLRSKLVEIFERGKKLTWLKTPPDTAQMARERLGSLLTVDAASGEVTGLLTARDVLRHVDAETTAAGDGRSAGGGQSGGEGGRGGGGSGGSVGHGGQGASGCAAGVAGGCQGQAVLGGRHPPVGLATHFK